MHQQRGQEQLSGGIELHGDENTGPPGSSRFNQMSGRPEAEDCNAPQQVTGDQQKDQTPVQFAEASEVME
jgi:hypothetical protein